MSRQDEPEWMLESLRKLEASGALIKYPPGWQPPRITVDDFQTEADIAVQVSGKLHRVRELLDKRTMDPHLRQEFIAAIEHGEGCGCYYCLGPTTGNQPAAAGN